jgi:hypothetical protein
VERHFIFGISIRYAQQENANVNLANRDALPAFPFRVQPTQNNQSPKTLNPPPVSSRYLFLICQDPQTTLIICIKNAICAKI